MCELILVGNYEWRGTRRSRILTLMVLIVIDLLHVVVNLTTLRRWDVRGRVLTLMHKLLEERVDLTVEGLPI